MITSADEKERILHSCHSHPTSGHFGITKTRKRVSARFYWKSLSADVQELVSPVNVVIFMLCTILQDELTFV